MSERAFRIKVRGIYDQLSPEQRDELIGHAAEHDVLNAAFTTEGHLSYDLAARPFFTFRYLESGQSAEDIAPATARALAAATAWLTDRGYGFRDVKTEAEDMSQAALSKRQRRGL